MSIDMKHLAKILSALLLIPSLCYASPTITSSSKNGDNIILTGNNFGESGTLIAYDSFEDMTVGEDLTEYKLQYSSNDYSWAVTSNQAHTEDITNIATDSHTIGNVAYLNRYTDIEETVSDGATEWRDGRGLDFTEDLYTAYFSVYVYFIRNGDEFRQIKFPRLSRYNSYNDEARYGWQWQDANNWTFSYGEYKPDDTFMNTITGDIPSNSWVHIEYDISIDKDSNESETKTYLNGTLVEDETEAPVDLSSSTGFGRLALINVMQLNKDTSGSYDFIFDNVYLSSSRARVVVGNASTWANVTESHPLPFISWSENSITVVANKNYYPSTMTHLFVIDENGDVSNGYLLPSENTVKTTMPANITEICGFSYQSK